LGGAEPRKLWGIGSCLSSPARYRRNHSSCTREPPQMEEGFLHLVGFLPGAFFALSSPHFPGGRGSGFSLAFLPGILRGFALRGFRVWFPPPPSYFPGGLLPGVSPPGSPLRRRRFIEPGGGGSTRILSGGRPLLTCPHYKGGVPISQYPICVFFQIWGKKP
jgi:hypothetical protein